MGKQNQEKERHTKAFQTLVRLQRTLVRRLTDFVIENETSLRRAAEGTEGYGYTVHQLDELFLGKLNLIERSTSELQKSPTGGVCRYRTLCFRASSAAVEEEINARIAEMPEARILGVSVSPTVRSLEDSGEAGSPDETPQAPADSDGTGPSEDELLVTVLYYGPAQ